MAFTKITDVALRRRGATTLPDQPSMPAQQLKEEFDAPAKQVVAPAFNNLIDELEATSAAADIGAVAPAGLTGSTVQSVINSIGEEIGIAIIDSHTHPNKSLLDTYTQTETDLADAVTKKHDHSNKPVLDKFSEGSDGKPLYNGIGIGAVTDAYKNIKVGSDVIQASGEDTFELVAGSNIILTPDTSGKKVEIKSTGGGGGGGSANWGDIGGTLADQTDLKTALDAKQDDMSAGAGIEINSNAIEVNYGDTLKIDSITSRLEVVAKNLYVPTGTSSDRPISGQGVKDALDTIQNGSTINDFDDVEDAFADIQNGTSINDFSDVEDALDDWTELKTTLNGTTVAFSGLNDSYGYLLCCTDKLVSITNIAKTGSGTNVTYTYTVDGAAVGDTFRLRIFK